MSGDIARLRNIGIIAHIDAGKTTVTEGLLFFSGVERRMGRIDDGNTVMDYLPEERERGITITSAACTIPWKNFTINIIDTPGHVDFTAEVERSLRILDGAVVVFDGVNGVEAQSETVWIRADRYKVPRMCFINKMDRVGADFYMCLQSIRERLSAKPVAIQIPLGLEKEHHGIIDLVTMKAYAFPGELSNNTFAEVPIPPELMDEAKIAHDTLVDMVAEHDDLVCEAYLSNQQVREVDLKNAIRKGTLSCAITPVLCGSGLRNVGLPFILDAVCEYLPSPSDLPPIEGRDVEDKKIVKRKADPDEPLAALAFKLISEKHGDLIFVRVYSGVLENGQAVFNPRLGKTERVMRLYRMHADHRDAIEKAFPGEIAAVSGFKETRTGDTLCLRQKPIVLESMHFPETVVSMAIEPRSLADKDKLADALTKLTREDPTFTVKEDADTGQTVISGLGELHLEIIKHRLLSDYKVDANVGKPRVAYRQTIDAPCSGKYIFEHQTPTKKQFAGVSVKVEPWPESKPIFVNTLTKDQLPLHFWPAVEDGALGATQGGTGYGYPMINIKITLTGVEFSPSESTEVAFQAAAAKAFDKAIENGKPIILEPQMKIEVQVPDEFLGEILNDLNMRKAQITDVGSRGKVRVVQGIVSLSQMFGYATTVRSLSQGRAQPSMELYKYAPASPDVYAKFNF